MRIFGGGKKSGPVTQALSVRFLEQYAARVCSCHRAPITLVPEYRKNSNNWTLSQAVKIRCVLRSDLLVSVNRVSYFLAANDAVFFPLLSLSVLKLAAKK